MSGPATRPPPSPQEGVRARRLRPPQSETDHYDNVRIVMRVRFWLPAELEEMWRDATAAARLQYDGFATTADVIELFLDAFLEERAQEALEFLREHPVLERDGWRCAVPTCGRRTGLHVHHLCYRSAGGGNEQWNQLSLCAAHHLQGLHEGRLRVTGFAPHGLLWQLGLDVLGAAHLIVDGRTIVRNAAPPTPAVQTDLERQLASPLPALPPEVVVKSA